jgi:hypothetical protein
VFAQTTGIPNTAYVDSWIITATTWLSRALSLVMVLMTLFFLWNVFKFVRTTDAAKQKEYKQAMINGIIGLFIAVSVWGIINIAGNVFGTRNASTPGLTCPPGTVFNAATNRCTVR